jgi:hypothetical protein
MGAEGTWESVLAEDREFTLVIYSLGLDLSNFFYELLRGFCLL